MRVLDLFSGIGGFSLGLERAGMTTVAFCEIEPFCRLVLAERWPEVRCYDDVRSITAERLRADGVVPDVICGGFPCQDISLAGKGAGLSGARSGLFYEVVRLIGEIRPRWVFLENVSALRSRGLEAVLGELSSLGYDAQWHCVPASAVGAPHRRDRIWIVAADADRQGQHDGAFDAEAGGAPEPLADVDQHSRDERRAGDADESARGRDADRGGIGSDTVADALRGRPQGAEPAGSPAGVRRRSADAGEAGAMADTVGARLAFWEGYGRDLQRALAATQRSHRAHGWWSLEPPVGRVAHGHQSRLDRRIRVARLRALGNAVVPQIPEIFGRAMMSAAA